MPLTLVAALLLVVAGCGTAGSGGDMTGEPGDDGGASRAGTTELTIVVTSGQGGAVRTYSLTCDPAGGDHPDPEAACRLLDELDNPFAPVPRDTMCTEIYGGPQTATVTGTLKGEQVDAQFSRTNGCEIARWDEHVTILVEPGGAEAS